MELISRSIWNIVWAGFSVAEVVGVFSIVSVAIGAPGKRVGVGVPVVPRSSPADVVIVSISSWSSSGDGLSAGVGKSSAVDVGITNGVGVVVLISCSGTGVIVLILCMAKPVIVGETEGVEVTPVPLLKVS